MLRLLFFIFCFYLLYRILRPSRRSKKTKGNFNSPFYPSQKNQPSAGMIVDEMKKCPTCGTFNPKSHAFEYRGEYYCGEECRIKI